MQVRGLVGAAELNGRTGVVLAWLAGRARFRVRLDPVPAEALTEKCVKPDNLWLLPMGEQPAGAQLEAASVRRVLAAAESGTRRI